tara:strand:- start:32588 stop:32800 length:213 start_codon:yes stop_codon:yes gene_type:complete
MEKTRVPNDLCPNCLGEKTVFNGEDYEVCPLCFGDGTYNEFEVPEEDFFIEEDYIPFDENEHSQNDSNEE